MKIFYASVINGQMGEINEAEHGNEWDGDVLSYLENALGDADIREGIPGGIGQNFGNNKMVESIYTVHIGGEPMEIWFAAEDGR